MAPEPGPARYSAQFSEGQREVPAIDLEFDEKFLHLVYNLAAKLWSCTVGQ